MKKYILFAVAVMIASACEKVPSASVFDGEFLVYTAHSEDAGDFSRFDTFTVADSLLAIDGDHGRLFLNDWAKSVRDQYIREMEAKGYSYVDEDAEADLGIQISYVESTSYFTAYYPSYPWWLDYPGYWYPWYWGDWGSWRTWSTLLRIRERTSHFRWYGTASSTELWAVRLLTWPVFQGPSASRSSSRSIWVNKGGFQS